MTHSIEEDLTFIRNIWGSEDALRTFLESEVARLCRIVCGPALKPPRIDIRPSMMARGMLGFSSGLRSAEYEPSEGNSEAVISLYPSACLDARIAQIALAHELIHHWELSGTSMRTVTKYSRHTQVLIRSNFKDPKKERVWRAGHSPEFVAKAIAVATILDISLTQMLLHRE